jgi:signal recognition particle subunit SRP54
MLVGLQGSGKTTTTAKLAKRLSERERTKVLMASLDVALDCFASLAMTARRAGASSLPFLP